MEIREATEGDIGEIVALLKHSLGESLMPKSEQYWRWKHLENPFGPSPVLLCWEGSELIGVRAFMRWEWIQQGQVYRAVRAVDTATHPAHQGKGIFKKLTLALVDYCKQQGVHFVFNTPNQQSKPGYLKMGWEEAGKLPVYGSIQRPFSMMKHFISKTDTQQYEAENNAIKYYLQHDKLSTLLTDHHHQTKQLTTNISAQYLTWRYVDVPVANYVAIGEEQGEEITGLIIGRIKKSRWGRELRITDCFMRGDSNGKELMKKFKERKKEWDVDYTTLTGTTDNHTQKIFGGLTFKTSIGPTVTIRSLAMTDLNILKNFHHWSPALGDLELF